jgi:vitamin B12 transporter
MDHRHPKIARSRLRPRVAAFVVLAGSGSAVHAAPATALAPVVVSSTTYPEPLTSSLPSVSVITRDEIAASGAPNLTTLLRQATGVEITSYGGTSQAGNVFIRGFSGPDVLVLVDGVAINAQDASGNAYLSNLQTRQIERVEIVRGNVSAIYGSGAVGGVVLITTRRASTAPVASVTAGVGSRGSASSAINASTRVGATSLQAGFSRYTTQGIPSLDPVQSGLPNQSDGYRNDTVDLAIRQQLAPGHSLGLHAYDCQGRFTYDNATAGGNTHQRITTIDADDHIGAAWTSHLSLAQQTTDSVFTGAYALAYRTRIGKLEWRNVVDLESGWKATAGLDLEHQSIDSSGQGDIPSTSRHANALFAGIDGQISGNELQVNIRRDDIGGFSAQDTGYLGWGHAVGAGFKLIASASTAFNAPPLGYLYYQVPGTFGTIPNPSLRPEKAHSLEAGVQWASGAQYVRATLFQTAAHDQWAYVTVDSTNGIGQFQNIASARTRGLELTAHGSRAGWNWHGNFTLQDPVNLSPGAAGATLPLVAHTLANAGVEHVFAGATLGADMHFSSKRYDPFGGHDLGAYAVFDLSARRSIDRHWSWNLRIDNLFNRKYQTNYGYQREPFGAFIGLTWTPT